MAEVKMVCASTSKRDRPKNKNARNSLFDEKPHLPRWWLTLPFAIRCVAGSYGHQQTKTGKP